MTVPIIARSAVDIVSAIFALAGLINLGGITRLRAVYRLWHYPHNFYRIVGLTQLMAALFLIVPETRVWGVVVSGTIIFLSRP
ncbi:MAG TPA: DoxX family protein [Rhizomicrobium sp.]|jgi:multisubunit Na+/H+ antiporter MnhG subunit